MTNKRCCSNCVHQCEILKHPWNKGDAKGSIKEVFGYGCDVFSAESNKVIIFSDSQYGECELHSFKPNEDNGE